MTRTACVGGWGGPLRLPVRARSRTAGRSRPRLLVRTCSPLAWEDEGPTTGATTWLGEDAAELDRFGHALDGDDEGRFAGRAVVDLGLGEHQLDRPAHVDLQA